MIGLGSVDAASASRLCLQLILPIKARIRKRTISTRPRPRPPHPLPFHYFSTFILSTGFVQTELQMTSDIPISLYCLVNLPTSPR